MSQVSDIRSEEEMGKQNDTPKEDEDTPKEDEDTPKEDEDTPKEGEVTPKEDEDTPKEDEDTPSGDDDKRQENDTRNKAQTSEVVRPAPNRDRPMEEPDQAPPRCTEGPVEHQAMGPTPAGAEELHDGHRPDLWAKWSEFEQRFNELQSEFIEEPREAVKKAEQLMQEVVDHMTTAIRESIRTLHRDVREDTDTEQLRLTMRDYRDFIHSLGHRTAA